MSRNILAARFSIKQRLLPQPSGQQGNFGRNVLRGFGATQVELAFQRQFHLTEKIGLSFRGEFFDIFNHPNFDSPTNTLTSPLFGQSMRILASFLGSGGANGGFNPLYQIGGPRSPSNSNSDQRTCPDGTRRFPSRTFAVEHI